MRSMHPHIYPHSPLARSFFSELLLLYSSVIITNFVRFE
jgi:hypothetical protein